MSALCQVPGRALLNIFYYFKYINLFSISFNILLLIIANIFFLGQLSGIDLFSEMRTLKLGEVNKYPVG